MNFFSAIKRVLNIPHTWKSFCFQSGSTDKESGTMSNHGIRIFATLWKHPWCSMIPYWDYTTCSKWNGATWKMVWVKMKPNRPYHDWFISWISLYLKIYRWGYRLVKHLMTFAFWPNNAKFQLGPTCKQPSIQMILGLILFLWKFNAKSLFSWYHREWKVVLDF